MQTQSNGSRGGGSWPPEELIAAHPLAGYMGCEVWPELNHIIEPDQDRSLRSLGEILAT